MSTRPLCLIHGTDGLDVCTLMNATRLYTRLGFRVVPSYSVEPCDFLVILRGMRRLVLPANFPSTVPVHVYNYMGIPIPHLTEPLAANGNPVTVIEPHPISIDLPARMKLLVAFPAVYPEMWAAKPLPASFPVSHVGNRKVGQAKEGDVYTLALDQYVREGRIHVWGAWWSELSHGPHVHGRCRIHTVQHVFARCPYTVGLLAPFQRAGNSFASRFWMAPLCGTRLLSEPSYYCGEMPGVIEWDYREVEKVAAEPFNRTELRREALRYWTDKTSDLETQMRLEMREWAIEAKAPLPLRAYGRAVLEKVYRRTVSFYERVGLCL